MYKGQFPKLGCTTGIRPPPYTFHDDAGREIELRVYGSTPDMDEYRALVELFVEYDPAHRSLGVPPAGERHVRRWLDVVLAGHSVLAWHDGRPIGMAVLVQDEGTRYELGIFIHQDYLGAGIGTDLLPVTLSYGKQRGVEHGWLLVERGNRLAFNLYNDVGFAVVDDEGYDIEMALTL